MAAAPRTTADVVGAALVGCGVDTVRDVVEAAVAEVAPDTAGVVFDRAPAEPPLLQIGMRP